MGIYDRDYYQDEGPQGVTLRAPQSMVVTIIIINVVIFLAESFTWTREDGYWLVDFLGADAYSLINPLLWWQLLTAGFTHDPSSPMHVGGNMLGLFFLGRQIEYTLGKWEFLRFYLVAIVIGSIIHAARLWLFFDQPAWDIPCIGASGAVTAVVMLFAMKFPHEKLMLIFLPVQFPAWFLGVFIVVSDLFGTHGVYISPSAAVSDAARVAYHVHLAGAAWAAIYFFFSLNLGFLMPSGLARLFSGGGSRLRRGPKLKVHHGDRDEADLAAQADRILDKIQAQGRGSLTPKEKATLEEYSKMMQEKHRGN